MASNALVQTRIDSAIKEEAAAVLATMGLTVSDAVRLLLTRVAHDHAMPFDILIPNPETVAAMRDTRQSKLASATTVKQFQDAMNAED